MCYIFILIKFVHIHNLSGKKRYVTSQNKGEYTVGKNNRQKQSFNSPQNTNETR